MSDITKDELISIVIRALPNSELIRDFDTRSEENALRFTWRGHRLRVSTSLFTEEVEGNFLHGNDLAKLAEALFQRAYVAMGD